MKDIVTAEDVIDYIKSTESDAYLMDSDGELLQDGDGVQLEDDSA